ncbi:hypothetical protein [Nocardioides aequoreus]|uniref:hypothetical protein n=1 Tax=Nocardioides aequoreus TaxID=397278 RepID=UPI0012F6BE8C|nr:hypothetical protein [Nocardioides aequoreus]
MRAAVAWLTALAACVVLPVAMVAVWLGAVVDDTDRYVRTVSPLAEDPRVLAAVERSLTQRVVAEVEARGGAVGGLVAGRLEDRIADGVRLVVRSPQFRPAWDAANTAAHEELVAGLRPGADAADVSLDLGRVLDAVVEEVGDSLPVAVSPPEVEAPVTVLEGQQVTRARTAYQALTAAGVVLPVVWVVLVALALLVARQRSRVLALLGAGSAATLLLMLLALEQVRDRAVAAVPGSDRALSAAVWDGVTTDLRLALWGAAAAAAVLAVVGGLAAVVRR